MKQKKVFPRYYLFDPTLATINHFSWKHKLQIDFMNEISSRTDISISGMFSGSSKDSISKAFEFLTILDQPYPSFFHEYFSGQKGVYHTKHSKSIEPLCVLEEKCIYHPKGSHRLITKKIWDHFHKDYIQEALSFNADRFIDEFCEAASGISFTYKTAWDLKEKHLLDLYASIESRNHRAKKKAERDEDINQQAMEAEKAFPEVRIISQARSINDLKIRISKFGKIVQSTKFKGPVMLLGERGTGKTHFARAIHYSLKLKGAFIHKDCGAIPDKLFESEIFGHKKGAFTGAEKNKTGAFENAVGGTLFLDEIGNLSLNHQQKLLGVLQDIDGFWQYQVVGSSETKKSDAFVIVATNSDPETLVKEGKFRADLYDRLNREQILIPPLRERKCDIPLFFKSLSKNIPVSTDLENDLPRLDYDWPDNIRGLINTIEKIERKKIGNDDTSPICLDDLPESITQHQKKSGHTPTKGQSGQTKRKYNIVTDEQIKEALRNNGNNKNQAAKELGIDRKTIHNRTKNKSI